MSGALHSRLFRKALRKLYALTGFDRNSPYFYSYSGTGGEAGVSTGFGNVTLVYVRKLHALSGSTTGIVRGKGSNSGTGWTHVVDATGIFAQYNGVSGSKYALAMSDVGRLLVIVSRITGVPGNIETIVNRAQLSSVALSAFTASSESHYLGVGSAGTPTDAVDYVASLDFRGTPTIAQLQALCDTIAQTANVPTSFTGATVTHRHSLVDALAGTTVTDGQAGPASLTDTTTNAGGDALARSSAALTVREIPVQEGRHALGLTGFSSTAYLEASGSGIQGAATGFTLIAAIRHTGLGGWDINTYNATPDAGYVLYADPSSAAIRFFCYGFGDVSILQYQETAQPTLITVCWNGTIWELYANGVFVNSWTAPMTRNAGGKMRLGLSTSGGAPGVETTFYGVAGCDQGLTAAEVKQVYDNWRRSGRLTLPAGKTNPHIWDFALDLLNASPYGQVPESFADRGGSEAMLRKGGLTALSTGVRGFTTADFLRAVSVTPLVGSASGFSFELLADVGSEVSTVCLVSSGVANYSSGGWGLFAAPAGGGNVYFSLQYNNTAASTTVLTSTNFAAGLRHIACVYDGSVARLYIDGTLNQTSAAFTFKPATSGTLMVGAQLNGSVGVYPALLSTARGVSGGNFVWSAAEVATASSSGRATGKVQGVPSKTTYRYSFVDDVADAPSGLLGGISKERVSGTENLVVLDNGLRPARWAERAFGWNSSPISVGAKGFTSANYLRSANVMSDIGAGPCWFQVAFIVDATISTTQIIASNQPAAGGASFVIYVASGGVLTFGMTSAGGAGFYASGNVTLPAVGRISLATGFWDGSKLGCFVNRSATISSSATFTPGAPGAQLYLGMEANASARALTGLTILGAACGLGPYALAEHQARYDQLVADDGVISATPGKTKHLWLVQDGGGVVAATLADQGDGPANDMQRIGSPTLLSNYARQFAA